MPFHHILIKPLFVSSLSCDTCPNNDGWKPSCYKFTCRANILSPQKLCQPPPPPPHLRPNPCTFPLRPAEIHRHQSPGSLFAFSSRFFSSASTLLSPAPDSFSLRNLQRPPVDSKAKRMRISNHTFRVLCSALSRLSVLSHTPPSCSF